MGTRRVKGHVSRAYPGSGEAEALLRRELDEDETYGGVDVDIDELLAQGRCVQSA